MESRVFSKRMFLTAWLMDHLSSFRLLSSSLDKKLFSSANVRAVVAEEPDATAPPERGGATLKPSGRTASVTSEPSIKSREQNSKNTRHRVGWQTSGCPKGEIAKKANTSIFMHMFITCQPRGGGGVLPYMLYIGMRRCEGYGFQASYSRIGYINQGVWV